MATHDLPILGPGLSLDALVYPQKVKNELSLASAPGEEIAIVLPAAATIAADTGIHGKFTVPQIYVGTPLIVIRGILDGAPTTLVIAFGFQKKALADDEGYDAALGAQQIASASSVSQADEDVYEETIALTAGDYAKGDDVDYFFYIDDSVHTYTGKFLLTGLFFRFDDA